MFDKPEIIQADTQSCPFDSPRPASTDERDFVATLTISSLYLARNQTYRGHCQLIFDPRHAARPDQLTSEEWSAFCSDLYKAQVAIVRTVHPDHINIELLGNVVPHLHWHIVPRYRNDARWGQPIWLTSPAEMLETRLTPDGRDTLIRGLQMRLA